MSPQEYQDHQTTVEAQDQSYDNNTGEDVLRFFHAEQNERCLSVLTPRKTFEKGVKRKDVPRTSHHPVQRGDASCFFFVVTVPAQFKLSRLMVILAII